MSGVDDDLAAFVLMRAAEDLPPSALIARAWADDLLHAMRRGAGIQTEAERRQAEERRWLRESMEADALPEWCIKMVLEHWSRY
jgi:hypothetical protein